MRPRSLHLTILISLGLMGSACRDDSTSTTANDQVQERRGRIDPWTSPTLTGEPAYDCENDVLPSDDLAQFAQKCDDAIGLTVPAFDCDDGTVVPTTCNGNPVSGSVDVCDRPNVLNGVCDPGSRFQVLAETSEAIAVAHCRKQDLRGGEYGDVAVIQYNRTNGATCFYQALGVLDHQAPAPKKDQAGYWYSPAQTAGTNCIRCHDNGPFIRSPYLAQLAEQDTHDNHLPGTRLGASSPWDHRSDWNSTDPYMFIGNDFQSWTAHSVTTSEHQTCTTCHRLGVHRRDGAFVQDAGTALDLGPLSVATTQSDKLPHDGTTSPIWMPPLFPNGSMSDGLYDATLEAEAHGLRDCAAQIVDGIETPTCNSVQFARGDTCPEARVTAVVNGATQAEPTDDRVHTVTDLSTCASGKCEPGFCYWSSLHGPFWQVTDDSVALADAQHRGSFVRIYADGGWKVESFSDGASEATAPPGGQVECMLFSDLAGAPDNYTGVSDSCYMSTAEIGNDNGTAVHGSELVGDNHTLPVLTGLIGNVAISNGTHGGPPDWAGLESSGETVAYAHAPRVATPSSLAAEAHGFTCDNWTPEYIVQDVRSAGDVRLLTAAESTHARCFITGVEGTWDVTHDDGAVQPYAEIYWGTGGDRRLRVVPTDPTPGASAAVAATASCVRLK